MLWQVAYTVLFYLFAVAAISFAIGVTVSRRLLRAAVYLMGLLLTGAAIYIMLGAFFLAGVQVLVYVGGIVVVIIFAVMLTNSAQLGLATSPIYRKLMAFAAAASMAIISCLALWTSKFNLSAAAVPVDNIKAIGLKLLGTGSTGYVLPFEIISILLLAAVIGGIVIARRTTAPGQPFTTGGDEHAKFANSAPKSQLCIEQEEQKV